MPKTTRHAFFDKRETISNAVYPRQIAFAAAFLLPTGKLLEVPSLLARYAAGDLLVPATIHFFLQGLILGGLLFAASRSESPLFERMRHTLGKRSGVFYAIFATYYLLAAVLPVLDFEKFVYAAFFDTEPTVFAFAFFFLLSAFICTKGLKSVGRTADLCLFLFLLPFFALVVLSLSSTDFTGILPLFGTKFSDSFAGFRAVIPHFSDAVLLLPLIGTRRQEKGDAPKILTGYAFGALLTLLFLAIFYGTYASIAPRIHFAFSNVAQYFPALNVIGRIDLLFVYLLSVVLLFYTCLPLLYSTECLSVLLKTERKTLLSLAINATMFAFTLFFNKYHDAVYQFFNAYLSPVFIFIAYTVALFFIILVIKPEKESAREERTR